MTASPFPEWLHERSVDDQAFARAYDALTAEQRCRLKLCISQLYDHCRAQAPAAAGPRTTTLQHASGLAASQVHKPVSWCLVVLDQHLASAPRLLATVMPPLLAGVGHLQVLRLAARKSPWPAPLLAALELAGVEQVAQTPAKHFQDVLAHVQQQGRFGSILFSQRPQTVTQQAWLTLAQASCWRFWQPVFSGRAGVFVTDATSLPWELATLAWCQPDMAVELWYEEGAQFAGPPADLPPAWSVRRGDAAVFLQQHFDLVLAPSHLQQAALRTTPLVLGPGEESCWLWPDLQPCFFQQSFAAWSFSGDAQEYGEATLAALPPHRTEAGSPGAAQE